MTSPSEPPPPDDLQKALPLALELPAVTPVPVGDARAVRSREPAKAGRRGRRLVLRVIAAVVVLASLAGVAAALWLPGWLRRQFVQAAAERGITLQVDGAQIDRDGYRLLGLRATAPDLPGASLTAAELDVKTSGLHPSLVTLRGAALQLDGPWSGIDAAFSKWRAAAQEHGAGESSLQALIVEGSHLSWTRAIGDSVRVDAADVHLEVTWRGNGPEAHARSDKVTLGVPGGTIGPWRVDLDRAPGTSRARIALDPGVPEACTVLIVGDDTRVSQLDVVVPRSPIARLGLPPPLLGLRGKDLQLDASIHYTDLGAGHAEVTATGGLHSIESSRLPRPLDVTLEASALGDPRDGMTFKRSRLAAGPLVGPIEGTLRTFDDGFRVDLGWSAGPVPCAAFDAPLAEGQPFDIAYQLRKLAQATGIAKIAGDVSARGTAVFDSRDLGSTQVEFAPQATCQVALFGP